MNYYIDISLLDYGFFVQFHIFTNAIKETEHKQELILDDFYTLYIFLHVILLCIFIF